MKHLFVERDPHSGLQREYLFDGRNLTERTSAIPGHAKRVLSTNAQMRNDPEYARRGIKDEMQHVGRVPAEVWVRWLNEGFNIFTASPNEIRAKLRDPDYANLKVISGRV